MRTLHALSLAALLAASACAASPPAGDDEGTIDADPSDFDSKADGIKGSSAAVLALIDGAQDRIYAKLPTLTDKTLLSHLRSAAKRGVDVHTYVVVSHAAHPSTVLAAEQLEASGVDIMTERTNHVGTFYLLADNKLLVSATTGKTTTASSTVSK